MDLFLLCVCVCVVRKRSLRRADHSSRGVLPTVVRRWAAEPEIIIIIIIIMVMMIIH
jgi:hypothetical protein